MHSTAKLAVVFLYCLGIVYGFGYVIFFKDASPWWFVVSGFLLPSSAFIKKVTWVPMEEEEQEAEEE
jgi:hypothetical protein